MYKTGDKVVVKPNAYEIESADGVHFAGDMREYCGQVMTVFDQVQTHSGGIAYHLDDCEDPSDGYKWIFVPEWLEPYEEEKFRDIDAEALGLLFN